MFLLFFLFGLLKDYTQAITVSVVDVVPHDAPYGFPQPTPCVITTSVVILLFEYYYTYGVRERVNAELRSYGVAKKT